MRERGIPDPEVCVVCGGDLGDELCEVADRGRPTDEAHGPGPGGRGRGNVRLGRRPPGPRPGAPRACVSRHDATPAREAVRGELGMADAMRARPEGFLARLGGVPPGRLGHHPGWFLWDERTRGSDADRADTLSGQAATGGYDNTRFALAREPQPLWSYWEDKLAVSTVV